MSGFFSRFRAAIAQGHRAGRIVITLQRVVGRNMSSGEKDAFKAFFDAAAYSDHIPDEEIIMDYFYFLVSDQPGPNGVTISSMSQGAKERLISCIEGAIAWNILPRNCESVLEDMRSVVRER